MNVTINTDASFHPQFKVGAFSFWIVSNQGRIIQSGALKGDIRNPDEAEMKCILNAIHALKNQDWTFIKLLVINTDSMNSISLFKNDKNAIKRWGLQWAMPFQEVFNLMTKGLSEKIVLRHVPSHKNISTAKSWVNDWCDKKAKEALWKEINAKK